MSSGVVTQLSQAMIDLDALDKKIVGIWQRTDAGVTAKSKEYQANHQGYLGTFDAGSFQRAAPFTWTVTNNAVIEYTADGYGSTPAETRHETINSLSESMMQQLSGEDAKIRNWQRQISGGGAIPANQPLLEGTEWVLTSLNGKSVIGGISTIKFSGGIANGNAGCNWFGGFRYMATDADTLNLTGQSWMTAMACGVETTTVIHHGEIPPPVDGGATPPVASKPSGIMNQEYDYMTALVKAAAYRVIDNRLEIDNAEGVTTLVFTKKV
jgi:heat shock protein HslJ